MNMHTEEKESAWEGGKFETLARAIAVLDGKIESQEKRIEALESGRKDISSGQPSHNYANELLPRHIKGTAPEKKEDMTFVTSTEKESLLLTNSIGEEKETLEENIGGKWFARIGIAALVLGVSFFLKYAIDSGWIGETGRVILGIFTGIALLAIGEKTIRRYPYYGQITAGGGIAILYLALFAAHNFYGLLSQYGAFLAMALVTGAAIALSIRWGALSLMHVATLGGFVVPLLVSSGESKQTELFSYIAILDLAILAVSLRNKWHSVQVIGFLGTYFLTYLWAGSYYESYYLGSTLSFATLFFVIFSLATISYNVLRRQLSTGVEQLLSVVVAVAYFTSGYALLKSGYEDFLGFFTLLLAVYYFALARIVRVATPQDKALWQFLAMAAVSFITLCIPVQFEGEIVTIGWAVEAVLLLSVWKSTRRLMLGAFSVLIFFFAAFKYLTSDIAKTAQETTLIANATFAAGVALALAAYVCFVIAKSFREDLEQTAQVLVSKRSLVVYFAVFANLLVFFTANREINKYYNDKIYTYEQQMEERLSSLPPAAGGIKSADTLKSAAYDDFYEARKKLKNANSVALSIFWMFYGAVALAVGIARSNKGMRLGALALLIIAILKLFFYDLWNLGQLYRIISSITLGAVLLGISFAYQRYQGRMRQFIQGEN